ncbi:hypothetical protein VP01_319g7 [Puccinia sorghi]|uniref:Uncharacterized protein n=1 Tax=Puccinia sorghi TaxID=27349 RepID=A0A0L6UYF0_9BASI|nr:hypothetical protein VP01_319g7 [Puccinia sorghi]
MTFSFLFPSRSASAYLCCGGRSLIPNYPASPNQHLNNLLHQSVNESAVCDHTLLRTFAQSSCWAPSHQLIRQNPERLSILPAIGLHGPLAISVRADTYTAKKYKHFLKYDLVHDC